MTSLALFGLNYISVKSLTSKSRDVFHCVKSVCIRSFSGPYFPAFELNMERSVQMREKSDQKNSEYGHFSRSVRNYQTSTMDLLPRLVNSF